MTCHKLWFLLTAFIFAAPDISAGAADDPVSLNKPAVQEQPQEVFLSFNYQNLFNSVVIALYEDGTFFIPVSEVFSLLEIPHNVELAPTPLVSGSFLDSDNTFVLNFRQYTAELESEGSFSFDASNMLVGELDYYVTPEVFSEVFDLEFSVNFNNLLLQLDTPHELPVVAEFRRFQEREQQQRYSLDQEYYPLQYDRRRRVLTGGFLDYSLSANVNENQNLYTYNLNLGTEILGGDLQGGAFGSISSNTTNFLTDNFRWRYAWRDNPAISQLYLGQVASDGIDQRTFVGIRLTNEPIEPRYIYDEFEIEGEAQAGSEVELYFNEALYDYQEITEDGMYRFLAPIAYGTSRLQLRIYDPAGGVVERNRRIQIPYSFLPSGTFSYHLNAGQLDNPIFGSTRQSYIAQGDVAYGLTNWLTQKVGVEYLDEFSGQTPLFYSSTSARLFREYLLNIDVAPSAFYRVSSTVVYSSSGSFDLDYTYYSDSGLYNILGNDHAINGNLYLPFSLFNQPFNFRILGSHTIQDTNTRTRYRADLNTRISRLNIRASYGDIQTGALTLEPTFNSELTSSVTYAVGSSPSIPGLFRRLFLRGQVDYSPAISEVIQAEGQISKNIFGSGRIQGTFSRNFLGDFNLFSFGITIDFPGIRSSSTVRSSRNGISYGQNFLGSLGYDQYTDNLIASNRQQVGRAATSVRLFVDNNDNGTYDEGDEPINDNAVRIGRSGITSLSGEGVVHLSQLQPYNRINLEINKSAIQNPMLVPAIENFSFITDPNQYKPIEIPFYMSGVVSGRIQRRTGDTIQPVAGLRVYLASTEEAPGSLVEEMRTFNDGSFYSYEVPPGQYKVYIDSQQLDFLNAVSTPDTLTIEVQALSAGDFIEGLDFLIEPWEEQVPTEAEPPQAISPSDTSQYQVQIASFRIYSNATRAVETAENLFGQPFSIKYNPNRDLYAVRTMPIIGLQPAINQLLTIQASQFDLPALVVLNDDQRVTANGDNTFSVQLGAFSTQVLAERFLSAAFEQLDMEMDSSYDPEDGFYKVRTRPFNDQATAEQELRQIRNLSLFGDAFIPFDADVIYDGADFAYQVRIEGISSESELAFLNELTGPEGLTDVEINNGPPTDIVTFDQIDTWEEAIELKESLARISTLGKPVILLIEK